MVLVITQSYKKAGGVEVQKFSQGDWKTMLTALGWKRNGDWERIKKYVYTHGLNR